MGCRGVAFTSATSLWSTSFLGSHLERVLGVVDQVADGVRAHRMGPPIRVPCRAAVPAVAQFMPLDSGAVGIPGGPTQKHLLVPLSHRHLGRRRRPGRDHRGARPGGRTISCRVDGPHLERIGGAVHQILYRVVVRIPIAAVHSLPGGPGRVGLGHRARPVFPSGDSEMVRLGPPQGGLRVPPLGLQVGRRARQRVSNLRVIQDHRPAVHFADAAPSVDAARRTRLLEADGIGGGAVGDQSAIDKDFRPAI